MIPIPLIVSAIASWVARKTAKEVAPVVAHDVLWQYAKPQGGTMLKGKKTYIGIVVLLCSALVPQLGISESEVSTIVTALGTAAGGLMAIYGRIKANS